MSRDPYSAHAANEEDSKRLSLYTLISSYAAPPPAYPLPPSLPSPSYTPYAPLVEQQEQTPAEGRRVHFPSRDSQLAPEGVFRYPLEPSPSLLPLSPSFVPYDHGWTKEQAKEMAALPAAPWQEQAREPLAWEEVIVTASYDQATVSKAWPPGVLAKDGVREAKEAPGVGEKTASPSPFCALLAFTLPLLAILVAVFVLLLLVLLSPVLGRSDGLRQLGLLDVEAVEKNVTVVSGPLGACYPVLSNATSSTTHHECTSATFTPFFGELYTALSLSPSPRDLPMSFPLFPTFLFLSIVLLALSAFPLVLLIFPARPGAACTSNRRNLLLAGALPISSFAVGLGASVAQRASLEGHLTDEGSGDLGKVELGKAWKLLWTASGLVGAVLVIGGVGGAWLVERAERQQASDVTVGEEAA